jgi:serine/threonine protein phosphatase PrpC
LIQWRVERDSVYSSERVLLCHGTDKGLERKKNEDSYLVIDQATMPHETQARGMMFAIADGMGGHEAGEIASEMACKGLLDFYDGRMEPDIEHASPESVLRHLEKAFWNSHGRINRYADVNRLNAGMGTTLSVLVLHRDKALIAHVGDSRIYRLRKDVLELLTEDDTLARLSVEMGYVRPEEAASHPLRDALSQSVGEGLEEVHAAIESVEEGDIFLLCSDGLYHMITDDEIREILRCSLRGPGVCRRLIKAALEKGGRDNVTVIVIWVLWKAES